MSIYSQFGKNSIVVSESTGTANHPNFGHRELFVSSYPGENQPVTVVPHTGASYVNFGDGNHSVAQNIVQTETITREVPVYSSRSYLPTTTYLSSAPRYSITKIAPVISEQIVSQPSGKFVSTEQYLPSYTVAPATTEYITRSPVTTQYVTSSPNELRTYISSPVAVESYSIPPQRKSITYVTREAPFIETRKSVTFENALPQSSVVGSSFRQLSSIPYTEKVSYAQEVPKWTTVSERVIPQTETVYLHSGNTYLDSGRVFPSGRRSITYVKSTDNVIPYQYSTIETVAPRKSIVYSSGLQENKAYSTAPLEQRYEGYRSGFGRRSITYLSGARESVKRGVFPAEERRSFAKTLPAEERVSITRTVPVETRTYVTETIPVEARREVVRRGVFPAEGRRSLARYAPYEGRTSFTKTYATEGRRESVKRGVFPVEGRTSFTKTYPVTTSVIVADKKEASDLIPTYQTTTLYSALPTDNTVYLKSWTQTAQESQPQAAEYQTLAQSITRPYRTSFRKSLGHPLNTQSREFTRQVNCQFSEPTDSIKKSN